MKQGTHKERHMGLDELPAREIDRIASSRREETVAVTGIEGMGSKYPRMVTRRPTVRAGRSAATDTVIEGGLLCATNPFGSL
jgi:hypothetical protein